MKVITLHQPWATLMAIGAKKIETRSWGTNCRGDLGIHAAAAIPDYAIEATAHSIAIRETLYDAGYTDFAVCVGEDPDAAQALKSLPTGCIIATATLDDCRPTANHGTTSEWVNQLCGTDEMEFGNFERGRFGWFTADVEALETPIPAKGKQRLWDWWDMTPPEKLPHVFDVPLDPISMANPWNALVLMAAGTGFDILDPAAILTWDFERLDAAIEWMTWVNLAASDNVVRRKRLIQPEHCKGVIK